MPRGDRTGPVGRGPMTGRGLGYCADGNEAGYRSTIGFGRGFGRGFRRNYDQVNASSFEENELVHNRINHLETQLAEMKKILTDIKENNK